MPLNWTKEIDVKHPVFKSYRLIRAGRSKEAIIFLVYEIGIGHIKENRFMMLSLLSGFKKSFKAATEQEIRDKAQQMWSEWLDFAGLQEAA